MTKIEKAILLLAEHLERCPFNDYKVKQEVMDALGYDYSPSPVEKK